MKVDLSSPILEMDGSESRIPDGSGIEGQFKVLDLGTACIRTLMTPAKDDEAKDTPEAKMKRYQIGITLGQGGEIDLTAEEIALITKRAWNVWVSPHIPGRMQDLLDPRS